MDSAIPNDFFDEENMNKFGEMYRNKVDKFVDDLGLPSVDIDIGENISAVMDQEDLQSDTKKDSEPNHEVYGSDKYQYQPVFSIAELRNVYPGIGQEKQSIDIDMGTGLTVVSRIKLYNNQYIEKSIEDRIEYYQWI